ncbi:MAG: lamin tail domain-containing protein [Saprospiraceae bacterium]|nr:lamin tail domain-containing protein [Saprospiraceae bacterium]
MKKIFLFISLLLVINIHSQIIIQEIYGGSGGSGYTHNNDFVEIVNSGSTNFDISGYKVFYASQAGTTWTQIGGPVPPSSILGPGNTFVFCGVQGGTGGSSCNCGVSNGTNLNMTQGKVILIPNGDPNPSGACPSGVIVYGSSSNCSVPPTPSPSSSQSVNFNGTNWVLATPTPITILPIDILKFELLSSDNAVKLSFSTSSEINNSHFLIEWSSDAKNWIEIGTQQGSGTTREVKEYSFIHETPASGTNYYRLTQVDFDGRKETFPVKSVFFTSKEKDINIIPTLAKDNMKIEFSQPVINGRLLIYNMDGRMINSYVLAEGIDILRIDVSDLLPGQYIAKYIDGEVTISKKFIKQ